MNTNHLGGGALVAGYLLVLVLLFRDPASGVAAATGSLPAVLYFVVIPVAGLLAGAYSYVGGRHGTAGLFLLGSYLGVFGLALLVGGLLAADPGGLPVGVGVVLLLLALTALASSIRGAFPAVGLDALRA